MLREVDKAIHELYTPSSAVGMALWHLSVAWPDPDLVSPPGSPFDMCP